MKNEEIYERIELVITPFDAEDVITTSGVLPDMTADDHEMII